MCTCARHVICHMYTLDSLQLKSTCVRRGEHYASAPKLWDAYDTSGTSDELRLFDETHLVWRCKLKM